MQLKHRAHTDSASGSGAFDTASISISLGQSPSDQKGRRTKTNLAAEVNIGIHSAAERRRGDAKIAGEALLSLAALTKLLAKYCSFATLGAHSRSISSSTS